MATVEELRVEITAEMGQFKAEMAKFRQQIDGAKRSTKKFDGGNRQASATLVELSRGVSDARFGFVGLANNAEQALFQFKSLSDNTGSLTGAFGALGRSLLGPTGILVGLTALIAYGPEIIGFFRRSKEEANEAADAFNKAADAAFSVKTDPFNLGLSSSADADRVIADLTSRAATLEDRLAGLRSGRVTAQGAPVPGAASGAKLRQEQIQSLERQIEALDTLEGQARKTRTTLVELERVRGILGRGPKEITPTGSTGVSGFKDVLVEVRAAAVGAIPALNAYTGALRQVARIEREALTSDAQGGGVGFVAIPALLNDVREQAVTTGEALAFMFSGPAGVALNDFTQGLGQIAVEFKGVGQAFRSVGELIKRVLADMVAQIVAAIAKFAILRALGFATGGFSSFIGGQLGAVGGGGARSASLTGRLTLQRDMVLEMVVAADDDRMARGRPSMLGRGAL